MSITYLFNLQIIIHNSILSSCFLLNSTRLLFVGRFDPVNKCPIIDLNPPTLNVFIFHVSLLFNLSAKRRVLPAYNVLVKGS